MDAKEQKKAEQLKDRRDYRQTLIYRRNDIDQKIGRVEDQIKTLVRQGQES